MPVFRIWKNCDLVVSACEVMVSNGDNTASLSDGYSYDQSLTPIIASVNPNSGGTGGGTPITITGTGFG